MESLKEAKARKNTNGKNPFRAAGFFQKLCFTWMFPLFYKAYKTELTENDIFPHLSSHDSEILGDKLEKEWNKEIKNHQNPSLWRALARVFGKEMMFLGLGVLGFEIIRISVPFTLAKLLEFFDPDTTMTLNEAYIYAGIISCTMLVQITLIHHTNYHIYHMGMRLRVAAVSLIYRKALRLNKSALAEATIGQMVNLISSDVSRFETCTINVHNIWLGPIMLFVIVTILYLRAGWAGVTGVTLLLCVIPFQIFMAKKTSQYRLRTAIRTDERIRLMNEIIGGIQVIKMYTWEKPFAKIVETVRRLEMKQIKNNAVIKSIAISINLFLTRTLVYTCVTIYVLSGNKLNAQYLYVVSLYYELLRQCVSQAFSQGVTQFAEAAISAKRIKKFLLYDEQTPQALLYSSNLVGYTKELTHNIKGFTTQSSTDSGKPVGIHFKNVSTKWIQSKEDNVLQNIDFELRTGELATNIGKVGSGKSTLLHVILSELSPTDGTVYINGTISYASQEPWLFVGSVRQNIIFGQDYDVVKYHEVIRVCALERDFRLFPYGDRTIVGERGVSLSGGQRARINLARAIYKEADIYLLDDPLSAVDAHVGKQIFKECIEEYLKDKCVVLVTHQLQFLKDCKKIIILNEGKVDHAGTYDEIKNSGNEFIILLEESEKTKEDATTEVEKEAKKRRKTLSTASSNKEDEELEEPMFEKETKIQGKVTWAMYKAYFSAGGNCLKIAFLLFIFLLSQGLSSGIDYYLSIWVNVEQIRNEKYSIEDLPITNLTEDLNNTTLNLNETITYSSNSNNYSYLDKFWYRILTEDICVIIYSVLIVTTVTLIIGRSFFFFSCCIKSSINLHNKMFSKIVHATMRFFNRNPSGRILNRFSKDMSLVDEWLPSALSDILQIGLMITASVTVVATVTPLIVVPTSFILCIFYVIRTVYISTSRDIKRLEAITRSPVYSHLTASLQGLTTIRAFGAQKILKKEFDNYQDVYSSSYFMFLSANRTFGFWLDLHSVIFVTLVTFSFLIIKTETNAGSVGLAITQAISIAGWCQFAMRQWSEMENAMTSIERIKEYSEITPEDDDDTKEPPKLWPETGTIQFDNVFLRYDPDEPYVLKNLNFHIKAREKVGIVGRMGAGKSSIIAALFRLAVCEGGIVIDKIDSKTVPLNNLRSSISIIPQEPVLFSGTLRKNLDPFDEYSDQDIWNALEDVELKNVVADHPLGLESKISEGGSNFSVGQRQLVCLARAIVRKNKILVLDEATANVDPHTDGLIQKTIREKFCDCTVLTIAHRLHTIMDSDRVLVMDAGSAVEFDHPYNLLQNDKGVFSGLVKQTGTAMASNLADIASKTYFKDSISIEADARKS